jgi:hypothetical protein
MENDLEGSGCGLILRHYPGIRLDGLRKTHKHLSQDSRSTGLDLNSGPSEYESELSATRLLWSFAECNKRKLYLTKIKCDK